MNPVKQHPNAVAAAAASLGLGTLVVQAAAATGVHLDAQEGLLIAGGLTTAVMFIGRNGLVGTYRMVKKLVLHGTGSKPTSRRSQGDAGARRRR